MWPYESAEKIIEAPRASSHEKTCGYGNGQGRRAPKHRAGAFETHQYHAEIKPPAIVLSHGVNGAGKTTSIAKIANILKSRRQRFAGWPRIRSGGGERAAGSMGQNG
jgi:hypothetical protein